jgi:hypothetical protein
MKKSSLGWLLLLLFTYSVTACHFATATIVYDIMNFTPTTIHLTESVKLYAQISYVGSGFGVQPVNFTWYVNSTEVMTENSTSSTLIYTPKAVGTYLVNATVNGYSNGKIITLTVLPQTTPTPSIIAPTPTPTVPEYSSLVILPLLFLVLSVALVLRAKILYKD